MIYKQTITGRIIAWYVKKQLLRGLYHVYVDKLLLGACSIKCKQTITGRM